MPDESKDITGLEDVLAKLADVSAILEKHAKEGAATWVRVSEKAQEPPPEQTAKAQAGRTGIPARFVSVRQARASHVKPSGGRGR